MTVICKDVSKGVCEKVFEPEGGNSERPETAALHNL
jgi:hypothetical protein